MKPKGWSWASAKATGVSHIKASVGCDDAGACFEVRQARGSALAVIVSDGAGSARFSSIGARITCRTIGRAMRLASLRNSVGKIADQDIFEWLDEVRDRIAHWAERYEASPRDFACTLVAALIGQTETLVIHVGDGAIVLRGHDDNNWHVPSWPANGEYAGTTYFVTDDPAPTPNIVRIEGKVVEAVAFTDGLERLALSFENKLPFEPFFEQMLGPLRANKIPARNRKLSTFLQEFIESEPVNERTDDDKTLILARRVT
jgi:Protein phosphatase 2C